jgi:hypothetical protein
MTVSDLDTIAHVMLDLRQSDPLASDIVADRTDCKLAAFLQQVLSDKQSLISAAKLSHRHQLGFLKIVAPINGSLEYLRLHVWDQPAQLEEDIHSHCAHFQSRVVFGKFRENSFCLSKGNSYSLFQYHFDTKTKHASAFSKGEAGAKLITTRILQAGDIYTKRANQLHNVSEAVRGTVTVSVWGTRDQEALVLKPLNASAKDCVVDIGISVDKLTHIIQHIIDKINTK